MSSFFLPPAHFDLRRLRNSRTGVERKEKKKKKEPAAALWISNSCGEIQYAVPGIVQGKMFTVLLMVMGFDDMLG